MRFKLPWLRLACLFALAGCGQNPFSQDALFSPGPLPLTRLPVNASQVLWIQHYGPVDYGDARGATFHDGVDIGTVDEGDIVAAGDGMVTKVDLDYRVGSPFGYLICIAIGGGIFLEYHFETYADYPVETVRAAVKVSQGERVEAGQLIGRLLIHDGQGQVHFGVNNGNEHYNPKRYFTPQAAREFEELYNSGIEKRGSSGLELFED